MNIVCTIEARMNSSRFPGKILKKICGKTILEILINQVKMSKRLNNVVVATTKNKNDSAIIKVCQKNNVNFYRGSENNVLKRLVETGIFYQADIIVQLTSDNPFIDPEMLDYMINFFLLSKKIDYLTNNGFGIFELRNVPFGLDIQIYYFRHLKKILKLANRKDLKEHPSLYFYREGKKKFKLHNIILPKKFNIDNSHRLTLDEYEDYLLLNTIYSYFKKNKNIMFNVKDISIFFKKNPELCKINEKILQKKVRIKI
jgi:spore coat polysaccharide biosynthesis protein SpsF